MGMGLDGHGNGVILSEWVLSPPSKSKRIVLIERPVSE